MKADVTLEKNQINDEFTNGYMKVFICNVFFFDGLKPNQFWNDYNHSVNN